MPRTFQQGFVYFQDWINFAECTIELTINNNSPRKKSLIIRKVAIKALALIKYYNKQHKKIIN